MMFKLLGHNTKDDTFVVQIDRQTLLDMEDRYDSHAQTYDTPRENVSPSEVLDFIQKNKSHASQTTEVYA